MNRTIRAIGFTVLLVSCALRAAFAANNEPSVNLTDEQVMNLVNRSYQYVAMYNVNNKFALKQGGWNTCVADTQLAFGFFCSEFPVSKTSIRKFAGEYIR